MKNSIAFLLFCLVCSTSISAQTSKEVTLRTSLWFDLFENIYFKDSSMILQAEVTERFFVDPRQQMLSGVRVYLMHQLGEGWRIGPGFSVWFPQTSGVNTYEIRPAQQVFYNQKLKRPQGLSISHRIKIEERIVRNVANGELANDYTFSVRFRYRLAFEYSLVKKLNEKKRPLKLLVNNETFLQAGKKVVHNIFDQNRFFAGISATIAKGTSLTAGYLNVYRSSSAMGKFEDLHSFRFYFTHEFTVGKRKAQ